MYPFHYISSLLKAFLPDRQNEQKSQSKEKYTYHELCRAGEWSNPAALVLHLGQQGVDGAGLLVEGGRRGHLARPVVDGELVLRLQRVHQLAVLAGVAVRGLKFGKTLVKQNQ